MTLMLKDLLPLRLVEANCEPGETNAKTGCTPEDGGGGGGSSKSDSENDTANIGSMSAKEKKAHTNHLEKRKKEVESGLLDWDPPMRPGVKGYEKAFMAANVYFDVQVLRDNDASEETKTAVMKSYIREIHPKEFDSGFEEISKFIANRSDASVICDAIYEKNKEQIDTDFENYKRDVELQKDPVKHKELNKRMQDPDGPYENHLGLGRRTSLILHSSKTSLEMKKAAILFDWADTMNANTVYVQQYLVDKFKMGDGDKKGLEKRKEHAGILALKEDSQREQVNAAIDAIYNETQEKYKKKGIKKLTIFRGVFGGDKESGVPGDADHDNPLESWTTEKDVAKNYGEKLFKQEIPISRVFADQNVTPWQDWELQAHEVVLLGGTREDGNDAPPAKEVK